MPYLRAISFTFPDRMSFCSASVAGVVLDIRENLLRVHPGATAQPRRGHKFSGDINGLEGI